MTLIKSNKGTSVLELLLVSVGAAALGYALTTALGSFTSWQKYTIGKAGALSNAAKATNQLTNLGRFATGCDNHPPSCPTGKTCLDCQVSFSLGKTPEPLRFLFDPNPKDPTLSYIRSGKLMWKYPARDFKVCNGTEIKNGSCKDGSPSLAGNIGLGSVSLNNYFRYRILFLDGERAFSTMSGFYTRNITAAGIPQYVWTPPTGDWW